MALTKRLFLIIILQVSISQAQMSSSRVTVRALRGSCVVIPCTFSNPEPRVAPEKLSIEWWRHGTPNSLIYSSKPSNQVPEESRAHTDFAGDLKSGDCSLQINNVQREDAAVYYPWIEPLTKTYERYKVTVSDHPEELSLGEPGEMTEGILVKINCSVVHTCPSSPPTLTWDWKDSNVHSYHEDLSNGIWKVISEMYYTPMAQDHGKFLQCTANYTETITSKNTITMAIKCPDPSRIVSICAFVSLAGNIALLLCIIYLRVIGCKRGKTPAVAPVHSMVDNPARKGSSRNSDECQESVYQNFQHAGEEYDTIKV